MKTSTRIGVTTQVAGLHRYPKAPEEVSFLRSDHRHVFNITVEMDVYHDDRDIEYFMFKQTLDNIFRDTRYNCGIYIEFEEDSCEVIAKKLLRILVNLYDYRNFSVKVQEDTENYAIVTQL